MSDTPPTEDEVHDAWQTARLEGETQDQRAQAGAKALREGIRRQAGWYALVGMLLSVGAAVVAVLIALNASGRVSGAEAAQAVQEAQNRSALTSLEDANKILQSRGQAPIATPLSGDSADITAAAIRARVIAALPRSPSADQVASVLAPALAGNVLAPSPQDASRQLADYYARNRPADGQPGRQGDPGAPAPPITPEQIEAAVLAESDALRGPQGAAGDPGVPGSSPPCLSEPGQCRGADGAKGDPGAPGPACPPGTELQPVTFASGQTGQGCVDPGSGAPPDSSDPPLTEAPPTD